ncbi:MAG: hypothetical protein ACRELF_03200 [Gemmataceae bacterium]
MRPEDLLFWLRKQPFQSFRITMNNRRVYEVRHPELVRVMRTSFLYFTPSDQEDVFDRAEMVGLTLIDHIEPVEAPARPSQGTN